MLLSQIPGSRYTRGVLSTTWSPQPGFKTVTLSIVEHQGQVSVFRERSTFVVLVFTENHKPGLQLGT